MNRQQYQNGHVNEQLGPYVLGVLDDAEAGAVEEHLASCTDCAAEVAAFRELEEALGEVPPEAFLEGPPPDGDLLLQRTLRQVRGEVARARRTRWALTGVAAAASLAAVFWLGTQASDGARDVAVPPTAPTATAPVPPAGTRLATATDPGTGARMTVRVVPAVKWVRVNAAVTGVPPGERCRIVVVARDGTRTTAGGWVVGTAAHGEGKGVMLDGSAATDPADVVAVAVENEAGRRFVTVPL
ncbi:anti-sigma factor family protein [Streptomyces sp. NPDC101132]|uniref:anti-sigma factor family protein n=1 Tax=Streptomyces sp. NPDC101132 TaxID=3366110 RepID=UPI0038128A59